MTAIKGSLILRCHVHVPARTAAHLVRRFGSILVGRCGAAPRGVRFARVRARPYRVLHRALRCRAGRLCDGPNGECSAYARFRSGPCCPDAADGPMIDEALTTRRSPQCRRAGGEVMLRRPPSGPDYRDWAGTIGRTGGPPIYGQRLDNSYCMLRGESGSGRVLHASPSRQRPSLRRQNCHTPGIFCYALRASGRRGSGRLRVRDHNGASVPIFRVVPNRRVAAALRGRRTR